MIETEIIDLLNELKDKIESNIKCKNESESLNDKFRKLLEDTTSDSDSDSDSDSTLTSSSTSPKRVKPKAKKQISSESETDSDSDFEHKRPVNQIKYPKTKDELTIEDLEPVKYSEILLENDIKLSKLGKVISKVDNKLIVIQTLITEENLPTLDEETSLFDSNRKSIGKIFETFGPVSNPFYTVRFNNLNEIRDRNLDLEIESFVYYAQSSKYTKFVFNLDELRKQKGSDASWSNDNEPPKECLDYSDDEQEKLAKKLLKQAKSKIAGEYKQSSDSEEEVEEQKVSPKKFQRPQNKNFSQSAQKRKFQNNNQPNVPRSRSFGHNNNSCNNQQQQQRSQAQPQQFNYYPPHPQHAMYWQQQPMMPHPGQYMPYPYYPGFNPSFQYPNQFFNNQPYQFNQNFNQPDSNNSQNNKNSNFVKKSF